VRDKSDILPSLHLYCPIHAGPEREIAISKTNNVG